MPESIGGRNAAGLSESTGNISKAPEPRPGGAPANGGSEKDSGQVKALEQEVMDLKIVNRGKDYFIEQLRNEREGLLEKLITSSYKVGELETRLLQLGAPGISTGKPEHASMSDSEEHPSPLA